MEYAKLCMSMHLGNARYSADEGVSGVRSVATAAQISQFCLRKLIVAKAAAANNWADIALRRDTSAVTICNECCCSLRVAGPEPA